MKTINFNDLFSRIEAIWYLKNMKKKGYELSHKVNRIGFYIITINCYRNNDIFEDGVIMAHSSFEEIPSDETILLYIEKVLKSIENKIRRQNEIKG